MKTGTALTACLLIVLVLSGLRAAEPAPGPLDQYVAKPDDSYGWVKRREGKQGETQFVELILTSQTWREIVWKHQLFIIRPSSAGADTKHALLFITGSSWKDELEQPAAENEPLPRESALFATLAEQLKTPIAVLLQVPHQPILDGKYEDQIIAYTFEQFLKSGDETWPLLLPMVKSAVRGMDAVQELAQQDWSLDVQTFTISGASKRGWTTWLTGAADKRAVAIAPMVIDTLNMAPQMQHQLASWGKYSAQIDDYTQRGLQDHLQTDTGKKLRAIVDPYSYRERLTQPKLIMIGTNDEYWPLDALNLYYDDLPGEKHILYVPNNGHGLKDLGRVVGSLNALHQQAANGKTLPKLNWQFTNGGDKLSLRVQSDPLPRNVDIWKATSKTRDFRASTWTSSPAKNGGDAFTYDLKTPEQGFAAIFGEAVYDGETLPFFLSTNVRIVAAKSSD